jgi:two-component system cell cycle response regulator
MSARVLVVDDILPNVKLLEAKLSSEYYDVLTATSGDEALLKVEQSSPDIVLLDVMMPGMDGFEVCRRIKGNPATAHIPVVMVTALTDSVDKVRGLEAGADDFLSKPVNDTALMARVRSLVRLKMTVDEWRVRENTASQLGVVDGGANVMNEKVEHATVLVIEDQEFEADKIADTLARDHDTVIPVDTGIKAMELVSQHEFDLMIVSLNMKREDGLRLCSHLRSNERTRGTPIVMVGTEDDMSRIAHGLEIGAHDYIIRPVDRNELLARCRTQIRRRRFQNRLKSTYEISLSMALTDTLTGLYNRRYLEAHMQKLLKKNAESKKSLGVLYLDIDHFKQVNDTYGHSVGDEILRTFAFRLKDSLRSFDLVARLGGEEFVAILPDISDEMALLIAERLRRTIADKPIKCNTPQGELSITTSIGGTIVRAQEYVEEADEIQKIIHRADQALYEAKHGGRNCTVFEKIGRLDPEKFMQEPRRVIE